MTGGSRVVVRERIAPEITASLFANYRSALDAIQELVDNSVDSALPGRPVRVEVTAGPASLRILTVGGQGMGPRQLERDYLRWGGSPKRGRDLLGRYGQGGKAAIGHLGAAFTVEAGPAGSEDAWRFTDPDYRDRSRLKRYELERVSKKAALEDGFVMIRIDRVDRKIDSRRLAERLAWTYRPLLDSGRLALKVDGRTLEAPPVPSRERKPFRVRGGGGMLTGWVGLADGSGLEPGIRCYRLGRLICAGEFFGHPGPAHVPGMARLLGEVEIPNVPLTMNKSDFERDGPEWNRVEARMFALLQPWARRLAAERDSPPPASALKAAQEARRLLARVLRLSEQSEAFGGRAPAVAAETQTSGAPPLPVELPEKAPRLPRPPRPANEGERSRKGAGEIVVRRLDPSIRSMVEDEGGRRTVVVNSEYPLFKERRGDSWYQLQTAIREVIRSEPGLSATDYDRRVSELLVLAFDMVGRKRPKGRQLKLL